MDVGKSSSFPIVVLHSTLESLLPLVEQELHTLLEHLSSSPFFYHCSTTLHSFESPWPLVEQELHFFRKWPFSGEDDRGKTSPRALLFTRCDIQSERL